ncbi:WGR domain-containing protein [Microvirga sp. GCM10011540]|uniref:WGR domain-containing protein n=1 Tax=Microvirga sp. GCM10011540 TaxID=3317338 RepID=UPI003618C96D
MPNCTGRHSDRKDLFGIVRLVCNWGRIGASGQGLVKIFATEIEAGAALEAIAEANRQWGYWDLRGVNGLFIMIGPGCGNRMRCYLSGAVCSDMAIALAEGQPTPLGQGRATGLRPKR